MQKILVVRLQNNWNRMVEARYSYFPITNESDLRNEGYYEVDSFYGMPMLANFEGKISKATLDQIIYNEMYVKTSTGKCWVFDAYVCVLAPEGEDTKLVDKWKAALKELVMNELKSHNKELKEIFDKVRSLT